jgi:hypothetical protein
MCTLSTIGAQLEGGISGHRHAQPQIRYFAPVFRHPSAYVSIRQHTSDFAPVFSIRQAA